MEGPDVMENQGSREQQLNVNNLTPGIYLLNFSTEKGSINAKFVKQ